MSRSQRAHDSLAVPGTWTERVFTFPKPLRTSEWPPALPSNHLVQQGKNQNGNTTQLSSLEAITSPLPKSVLKWERQEELTV